METSRTRAVPRVHDAGEREDAAIAFGTPLPSLQSSVVLTEDRKEAWTALGALAGLVGASLVFVYLVGGVILWHRFSNAGLPATDAVSRVPHEEIVATGVREAIAPILLISILMLTFAWLTTVSRSRRGSAARRIGMRRYFLLLGIPVLILASTFVSLDWFGITSLIVLAPATALWFATVDHTPPGERVLTGRRTVLLGLGALLAATVLIAAKEIDAGATRLPIAHVRQVDGHREDGKFVAWSGGIVFIGQGHTLKGIPESRTRSVEIVRAHQRCYARSWLERLVGDRVFNRC
jgi:hypothetical protein